MMALPPVEGAVFSIRLTEGPTHGLIVRYAPRRNLALCYFYLGHPSQGQVSRDPVWITWCSDLRLRNGDWPISGRLPSWTRDDWPIPAFKGQEGDRSVVIRYDENLKEADRRFTDEQEASLLPEDGAAQVGFVEKRLARLLHEVGGA